jgi:pilus assembly protein Flp/PilA
MTGEMRSAAAQFAGRFLADERGATAIEYALIAAGIGTAIAGTVWNLGSALKTGWYDKIGAAFN